eukprot:6867234-Karenia_brevis.AAC.1
MMFSFSAAISAMRHWRVIQMFQLMHHQYSLMHLLKLSLPPSTMHHHLSLMQKWVAHKILPIHLRRWHLIRLIRCLSQWVKGSASMRPSHTLLGLLVHILVQL